MEEYLVHKAPFQIPMAGKEFLVKVAPYITIIFLIIALPIVFAALGLTAFLAPFAMMGAYGYYGWGAMAIVSFAVTLLAMLLELIALPGLFKRTYKGWKYLFYAQIVSLISGLISWSSGILGTLLGALIGFYLLFQVKEMYKK